MADNVAPDAITTDGDVGTLERYGQGDADTCSHYVDNGVGSINTGYYFELRYRMNVSSPTFNYISIQIRETSISAGSIYYYNLATYTDFVTVKFMINSGALGGSDFSFARYILFRSSLDTGESIGLEIDYLRISPANESGWQHDGSTTAGVENVGDATTSSDGDTLSIIKGAGGSAAYIYVDTTATRAKYDPDYYPFLEIKFSTACVGNTSAIIVYDGLGGTFICQSDFVLTQTTYRYNVRALTSNDIERVLIYAKTARVEIEHVKAYSIANWTITQANCEIDDYLYVNSGKLYSSLDGSPEYFGLDHDPTLSVAQTTYPFLELIISDWTDTIPLSNSDFWYQYYVGAWVGQQWDETWDELPTGTTTDFRMYIYVSLTLSAISFLGIFPQWYEVGEATIWFRVPYGEWGMNTLLIFLGLILIPASTLYLVYGGLKKMSMDKLFYGLIMFCIGWALFLGGIMI